LIPAGQDPVYGEIIINGMKNTGNIEETMTDIIENNKVEVYKNPTGVASQNLASNITIGGIIPANLLVSISGEIKTCGQAWNDLLVKLDDLKNSGAIECQDSISGIFNPTTMSVLTGDAALSTVPNARNIALNSAMANQIFDAKRNLAIGNEVSFAAGKSMSEFTTNSLGSGYYMAQMLPYLQMGMRAVLYAFFPFVFVVILLPGGLKVLLSYLQSLLWIELWTPTAAILDMFLGLVATDKFSAMYNSKGFNPTNGMQAFSDAAMLASVGGYLYASVPALTYLILKGSAQMLGNITSGVAGGFAKNLDSSSINRDVGDMKKLNEVNKDRTSKGEKMVSLAEMDSLESGHNARMAAGNWMTNEEHKGSLVDTGKGAALQKIMSATATQDIYGENSDARNSFRIKAQQDQINTKETQVATGTQDGDKKVMQSIGKTMGQEENQKIIDAAYKQKALGTDENDPTRVAAVAAVRGITAKAANALDESTQKELGIDMASDKDGSKMKAYVETKTNEFMTNYESERKTQEIFGGGDKSINVRSNNAAETKLKSVSEFNSEVETQMKNNKGMTRSEAIVKSASIIGKQNGLKESEIQERLDAFAGETGKLVNGKLTYSEKGNERLEKTVDDNARVAAHTAAGEGKTNATNKELEDAARKNKDTMVAEQNAIPKLNENTMKAAVQMGDKGSIALEGELARKDKKGHAIYSDADKNMKRAAYIKSNLGVLGKVAGQVGGSAEAKENLKLGVNATQKGQLAARLLQGTINGGSDLGAELNASPNGKQYMDQAQKDLKLEGNYKDLTREQQAAVSAQAITTLGNTNKAFKASIDHYTSTQVQKDLSGSVGGATGAVATSNVTDQESKIFKNQLLKAAAFGSNETKGEAEALLVLGGGLKTALTLTKTGAKTLAKSPTAVKNTVKAVKDKTVAVKNNPKTTGFIQTLSNLGL
jgi:hypothetical protein